MDVLSSLAIPGFGYARHRNLGPPCVDCGPSATVMLWFVGIVLVLGAIAFTLPFLCIAWDRWKER